MNSRQSQQNLQRQQNQTFKPVITFKKDRKVPPIFVCAEKFNEFALLKMIERAKIDTKLIKFFPSNNKQIRIQFGDLETYDKAHALLKSKDVNLHTHAVKERVKPVYIIKNLCENFDLNDIQADLNEQNFEVLEMERFKTRFHIKNNVDSKMIKVVLPEDTDTKAFEKVRYVLHTRVYIDSMKPAKILQCKRCQRLSHTANYCTHPYRCVKCTEEHEPGTCKLNAPGNTINPKCCNCNGEHIASSYECTYLKKAIDEKKTKKSQDKQKLFNRIQNQSPLQ